MQFFEYIHVRDAQGYEFGNLLQSSNLNHKIIDVFRLGLDGIHQIHHVSVGLLTLSGQLSIRSLFHKLFGHLDELFLLCHKLFVLHFLCHR